MKQSFNGDLKGCIDDFDYNPETICIHVIYATHVPHWLAICKEHKKNECCSLPRCFHFKYRHNIKRKLVIEILNKKLIVLNVTKILCQDRWHVVSSGHIPARINCFQKNIVFTCTATTWSHL